ncbi:MAG: hypothetical protein ABFS22_12235 [Pseudomonadota bacterium]
MKRLLLLLFVLFGMAGQALLAAGEGSAEDRSAAQQAPADQGSDSRESDKKKPAKDDEEPECD